VNRTSVRILKLRPDRTACYGLSTFSCALAREQDRNVNRMSRSFNVNPSGTIQLLERDINKRMSLKWWIK